MKYLTQLRTIKHLRNKYMEYNIERDNQIMEILKVRQLRHPLGWTDKGEFSLLIRKGEKDYTFMLDAVPLDEEQTKKLKVLYE